MITSRLRILAARIREIKEPAIGDELDRIANALDAYAAPLAQSGPEIQLREPAAQMKHCSLCGCELFPFGSKIACLNSGCEHFQRPVG